MNTGSKLFIAGPTGVGKSAFAIELALELDGEVVGADAFQIYQGLPLLTAQPSQEDQSRVPHHLIGVLPLTESCDAVRYQTMAVPVIEDIITRDRLPFITGGTGFYFRTLISPLDPLPTANPELRLSFAARSLKELVIQLEKADPELLPQLDLNNRRRVERALEIMTQTGRPLSEIWQQKKNIPAPGLLLVRDREELYDRITKNVRSMFDRGVVEEVAAIDNIELRLLSKLASVDKVQGAHGAQKSEHIDICEALSTGATQQFAPEVEFRKKSISQTASMTLGLREIQAYLRGKKTLEETMDLITKATKRYAKRQLTWFNNQHSFTVLNLSCFPNLKAATKEAVRLLKY